MPSNSLYPKDHKPFVEKHLLALLILVAVLIVLGVFVVAYTITPQSPFSYIANV